jgi:hypothetical protein
MKKSYDHKLEFDIDPEQGAAAFAINCVLKGYQLIKMVRKGRKMVCYYEKA